MDREIIERLIQALEANTTAVNRLADIEELRYKKWLNPEETCNVLGFPVTGKYNHRRKLQWLRENGHLAQFQDTRPIQYWSEAVYKLAEKLAKGAIHVPSKW